MGILLTLKSQKWLKQNSPSKNSHIIQQTGNENTQTYQVEVVTLIYHILITNLKGNVEKQEGRIDD